MAYFIAFLLSFSLSLILTPAAGRLAVRWGFAAKPRVDRWHKTPTGLFGGVSMFISMMLSWQAGALCLGEYSPFVLPLLPVVLAASAIFLLGLVDDILELNPQYKLIVQVIIASALVVFGFQVSWFESKTANLLVSIIWLVGITNAFNLLDNMDGLSAGIAVIAGFFLFLWLSLTQGAQTMGGAVSLILAAYMGGVLGFLIYNFHPASIFMGDAGSLFIGFVLACLAVTVGPSNSPGGSFFQQVSVIAIPCLILFIPILDTAFVSFMRRMFSRSVFQGGKDHSSHRLVAIGLSEKKAVLILYLLAVASGLIALGIYPMNIGVVVVVIALYLVFVLLFWIYLGNVKVYSEKPKPPGKENGSFVAVWFEAGYGRTLFSILLDLVLITLAYYLSYLLRFEGEPGPNFKFFLRSLPILFACQIFCFYGFGVYQRLWRGSRLSDLSVYLKGVTGGTLMAMLVLLFVYRFQSFSRAVFVIYWGLMLILISFSRFFFRMLDEWAIRGRRDGKPALIYGAGVGGQMTAREIETNKDLGLSLVGFIDDDPLKKGKKISGYPVFGGGERLPEVLRKHHICTIIVSFKANSAEKKKEIAQLCMRAGLDVSIRQMRLTIGP